VTLLAGVFDDNPPGGPFQDDSQLRGAERYGALFNINTGVLAIIEAQYATSTRLPGTYKLGMWFDSGRFPDQRFDDTGRSLADPGSDGRPQWHWHNYGVYGVIDQTVWRPGPDAARAIAVFARPMVAPADRNLISFSFKAGVTVKAPVSGRDNDSLGVGVGVANVSARASGLNRDTIGFSGAWQPVRGAETFIEVTYLAQITPWLQVQPDFQYFWMPGRNSGSATRRYPACGLSYCSEPAARTSSVARTASNSATEALSGTAASRPEPAARHADARRPILSAQPCSRCAVCS